MVARPAAVICCTSSIERAEQDLPPLDPAMTPFGKGILRGELCAFVPGYFQFIAETEATVQSVVHFMRGMRIRVAVHPHEFYVYNK